MLVIEPNKRYTVQQIKKHRWMQMSSPPTLPPTISLSSAQPNEQILRLMQSLGIDGSKTRESIRLGSYDHHAAIYYLLLDKLRSQLVGGTAEGGGSPKLPPPREPRRRPPCDPAVAAVRRIGRASTTEDCRRLLQQHSTPTASNSKICTKMRYEGQRTSDTSPCHGIDAAKLLATTNSEDALKILNQAVASKTTFTMCTEATRLMSTLQMSPTPSASADSSPYHQVASSYVYAGTVISPQPFEVAGEGKHGHSGSIGRFCTSGFKSTEIQTQYSSSTDEGVETDLEEHLSGGGPRLSYASSSSSSGVAVNFNATKSLSQNLSCDSNFESLEYPLSDSSELAGSLPSCTSMEKKPEPILTSSNAQNYSLTHRTVFNKHNPLVHMSSFKTTRAITRSPVDFREGRRASDGLVAQQVADNTSQVVAFNSQKFSEKNKTKGVLDMHLVQREAQRLQSQYPTREAPEEVTQRQKQHNQYLQPRGNKRISLPDNFSYNTTGVENIQLQTAMQHRLLQQKRQILQKQCAMSHSSQATAALPPQLETSHSLSRRQMLRQASYKIAQQQPVLPPLPLSDNENKDLMAFQALVEGTAAAASVASDPWSALPTSMQNSCQISEPLPVPPTWQTATAAAWNQVYQQSH
ncbi:unnamed protein product [Acanthoscelides obtectus]|nr:unnamed protein product [Acanthoscelides obtectus]CAK1679175.1 Serine/threonine-protein kinase SIK2 [Acanthoscelides obtectus]